MNAEEKYQAELKQSNLDHHQPTAAAMTGHIISNLSNPLARIFLAAFQSLIWCS